MEETQLPIKEQNLKPKKTFFQRIAFILLDDERKTEVAGEIIEDGKFGKVYWLQIILSVIICTFGLLVNSVPVIIGAMLIAPILIPIKIIAFATATGNGYLYNKGLKTITLSILVSIAISVIITKITPVATLTPEIYARISPTIIDLFIALAGGIIAFLSLGFKKLWEGIAGVAMATALIPPLCVTGIGISFLSLEIAKGSFLLFLTNFVAIIFVGIIIFYAFGFFPTNKKGKKNSIESIFLTIITIVLIITPLTQSMRNIAENIQTKQTIEKITNKFLGDINKEIEIEKISYQTQENSILRIDTTISVPNTTSITEKNKNDLSQILALSTQKSVNLNMNIVNISSVLIEKKEEISNDKILQEKIKKYITIYTGITIIESKIAYNPFPLIYINLYTERNGIKEKIQIDIEKMSKETIGDNANVFILWQQKENKEEQQKEITYFKDIENFIKESGGNIIEIDTFQIEKKGSDTGEILIINMDIKSPLDTIDIEDYMKTMKEVLEKVFQKTFILQIHTIKTSMIKIE